MTARMPVPLARKDEEASIQQVRRPKPRVLLELGTAMWDLMHAFDRVFRSLGIPTAMSFAEEEEEGLRVETVELSCSGCGKTTVIDAELRTETKFCSYCGQPVEGVNAEATD